MSNRPTTLPRKAMAAICETVWRDEDQARQQVLRLRAGGGVVEEFDRPLWDPYGPPTRTVAVVRDPQAQHLIGEVRFRAHEPGS
jgi:hypothetical protein